MSRRRTIATVALILCATVLQGQVIRVGEPTVVARAPDQRLLAEPHLAVHPAQPNHLLAAAMVWPPVGGSFQERVSRLTCTAFLSVDGGKTWEQHDFPLTNCFDPWVAITPDGRAVFSVLAEHPALPEQGRGGWAIFHSPDGGHTWDDTPLGLGRGHDHSTMVVDATSSPHRGTLYVLSHHGSRADDRKLTFDVFVARSRDAGKTFDEPVKIIPNNVHNLAEMPVVLSNGTLVVSFVDAGRNVNNFEGRAGAFERRRTWVLRSSDGGKTFSIPLFVNDACGPPPGFQLSALAVDLSDGPFRDRLYFACRRHSDGPIVVNYSADGGETWTDPVPAHLSRADSTAGGRKPVLAVNARGVLGVASVDQRGQLGDHCQEIFFTASLDGGRTFLPEQRVSSAPCADAFGDYFGIVITPDGRFRLLWPEMRGGVSTLLTVTVEVEGNVVDRR